MSRLRNHELGPGRIAIYLFGFGLALYAAWRLVPHNPVGLMIWFGLAIIGHDLILLPLYGLADHGVLTALRRFGLTRWIGHLRVPAFMSGVLLLIFLPQILESGTYLSRWLLISLLLFAGSALVYLGRYGYHLVRTRC